MQYTAGFRLECTRVHLLQLFQRSFEGSIITVSIAGTEVLDPLLQFCDFLLCTGDDIVDGIDITGLGFTIHHVYIDVWGNFDISVGNGLQEGGFTGAIFTEETIALAIVEGDTGVFEEKATVEGECIRVDLDITGLDV
jgi:hypothetical protein